MTETLIKDSIYKVLSLFKPYGDLFEVCQTPGKYIPRLIFITVTNFQGTTVFCDGMRKKNIFDENIDSSKTYDFRDFSKLDNFSQKSVKNTSVRIP